MLSLEVTSGQLKCRHAMSTQGGEPGSTRQSEFPDHLKVKAAWNFGNVQYVAYNPTFINVLVSMY